MNDRCPVCDSDNVERCGPYRGTHKIFSGLLRARCRFCDMVFTTPMPSEKALHEYNKKYFTAAHGGIPTSRIAVAFFSAVARLRVAYLERYLGSHRVSVSRLLEYGPGTGFFAAKWLDRHPDTTYMALETDASCHSALARLGIQLLDPVSLLDHVAPIDMVVMSHVLEHVIEPRIFLEYATKNLRKGGVLFIEVPCLDYQHKPVDEPHLLFFDKKPMLHLLSTNGFENIELAYYGREIDELRSKSVFHEYWLALRSRLIGLGLVLPFAGSKAGLEVLDSQLEKAVVAPFKAHRQSVKPTWWLRALARKV